MTTQQWKDGQYAPSFHCAVWPDAMLTHAAPLLTTAARPSNQASHLWRWGGAGILCLGSLLFFVTFRHVNLDEGWYLWAGKLVYANQVLYRDFAYTQTPLLPYLYGITQQIAGGGLIVGRLTTLFFALLAWGFVSGCAHKLAGPKAAIFTLLLLSSSFYAAAYFSYTATYALTAFWMATALFVAIPPFTSRETVRNTAATLLFCCAVATRLSTLIALLPFALYLILSSQHRPRALFTVGISTLVSMALLLGPFWLLAGEQMRYSILEFHTAGALGYATHLNTMLWSLRTTFVDFGVPLIVFGFGIFWLLRQSSIPAQTRLAWATVGVMTAGLFAVHLLPRTTESYYNSLQMPLLALLAAVMLISFTSRLRRAWTVVLLSMVLVLHGALQINGVLRENLIDLPPQNRMHAVQEAVDFLRIYLDEGDLLLSFNTHLALEAALAVPAGMEMSIFSYHPTWTDEQAQAYKGINNNRLLALLADPTVDAVALTTFDTDMLYGARQEIFDRLVQRFRWATTIPDIGPHLEDLHIYLPPQFDLPTPAVSTRAQVGESIVLLGYDLTERTLNGEQYVQLALYWQSTQRVAHAYTVFTQLINAAGERVAGWDNPPCRQSCPTTSWLPGEILHDEYWLPVTALTPGEYTLVVGMYDAVSGERLPVRTADGNIVDQIILAKWQP